MTALLTPLDFGAARQAGATLWRKQLLPVGEITYKDRKIAFTREYLAGLVKAFRDKAYDAVPLQFADHANTHTNDPDRRRGTVRDLELTDDGLDVLVEVGADTARKLAEYPDLGVSARIVEGYDRADGRFFPAAVQHVLATLDPRIPGMRPWQAVEAANDADGDVLDLTAIDDASAVQDAPQDAPEAPEQPPEQPADPGTPDPTEDTHMALTAEQEARLAKLLDLPDDRFDALLADPQPGDGDGDDDDTELTDAELADLLAEAEAATGGEDDADLELEPAGAQLTAEAQAAIDLANARAEQTEIALARVTSQLAAKAYEAERETLARTYGIPPRITDLARPLLEGEGRTVDLANGRAADAGAIVRQVLAEIGKTARMLDLSAELGTPLDGAAEAEAQAAADAVTQRKDLVSAVRQMTGI